MPARSSAGRAASPKRVTRARTAAGKGPASRPQTAIRIESETRSSRCAPLSVRLVGGVAPAPGADGGSRCACAEDEGATRDVEVILRDSRPGDAVGAGSQCGQRDDELTCRTAPTHPHAGSLPAPPVEQLHMSKPGRDGLREVQADDVRGAAEARAVRRRARLEERVRLRARRKSERERARRRRAGRACDQSTFMCCRASLPTTMVTRSP